MTYDENSNPVDAQQEDAWLDDLKAFLDEDPSNPPKPVPDFPNPFETEMSDVLAPMPRSRQSPLRPAQLWSLCPDSRRKSVRPSRKKSRRITPAVR